MQEVSEVAPTKSFSQFDIQSRNLAQSGNALLPHIPVSAVIPVPMAVAPSIDCQKILCSKIKVLYFM